jgi:hypothetical protein
LNFFSFLLNFSHHQGLKEKNQKMEFQKNRNQLILRKMLILKIFNVWAFFLGGNRLLEESLLYTPLEPLFFRKFQGVKTSFRLSFCSQKRVLDYLKNEF